LGKFLFTVFCGVTTPAMLYHVGTQLFYPYNLGDFYVDSDSIVTLVGVASTLSLGNEM